MIKQQNLFYSQPSTVPKDAPATFYLSACFGFIFMIPFVAPTRSLTFYAYLIIKIGNRNLKKAETNDYIRTLSTWGEGVTASKFTECAIIIINTINSAITLDSRGR